MPHRERSYSSAVRVSTQEEEMQKQKAKYLKILSQQYPTLETAACEAINLRAILGLPKGTEQYVSDLHGAFYSFDHTLRNASGVVRFKIEQAFGMTLSESERAELGMLVYYPEQKMRLIFQAMPEVAARDDWLAVNIYRLVMVARLAASKYTRSKVTKALPKQFSYMINELIHEQETDPDKRTYYTSIIREAIDLGQGASLLVALCRLIQRLAVDHLHVLGDVYDRGSMAHRIMDTLMHFHSIDVAWGNHDMLWMGAAAGSLACICNVLRISLRYNNLDTIENGYGISLLPLATFAMETYADDPCEQFIPKGEKGMNQRLVSQLHKAIAVMQFKVESTLIDRNPSFDMADRQSLRMVDWENYTITIDGQTYPLKDKVWPTVDPANPTALSEAEIKVLQRLRYSFQSSPGLQEHIRFLFQVGSIYLVKNGDLLFHGCIPVNADGTLIPNRIFGKPLVGVAQLDAFDKAARDGYFLPEITPIELAAHEGDQSTSGHARKQFGQDVAWYLWAGPVSPLFGRSKMATFERYFIEDKAQWKEPGNAYYKLREDEEFVKKILAEFDADVTHGHIINGHVPVRAKDGEMPVKANGRLIAIDGGYCEAYQGETGTAGYTLINDSHGLKLAIHRPFSSRHHAVDTNEDMVTELKIIEKWSHRLRVAETDTGIRLKERVQDLKDLMDAYRAGDLAEGTYFNG
ncbi:Fructose-1,6-bisphosphatase class 3 [Carpediemonas membranifera]|uniref:Fructose-1,6-bisphosphatase class 3 n=1 Tax=Carpediemonas membranifera TaxID=201153 RepID=A0A8J6ARQ9_9EUKA|nr:Fructose-1,6-bisphosphatase class 3 [Carpediemonas membranifera]|eukprot:KAG9392626.1 Fructose-1,6-bisphosphatase class 3 [Carpediemonas membranifera]